MKQLALLFFVGIMICYATLVHGENEKHQAKLEQQNKEPSQDQGQNPRKKDQLPSQHSDKSQSENKGPDSGQQRNSEGPSKEQLEREKAFGELMSNAVLEGHFTLKGKDPGKLASPEKYTLGNVTKQNGDIWLFNARIQYGKHDMTLPLPLRVVWSGDTPVITLDNFMVPGFGKFSCRVMIFDNQYAGMWDGGGKHGGLLFGKITKPDEKKVEEKKM